MAKNHSKDNKCNTLDLANHRKELELRQLKQEARTSLHKHWRAAFSRLQEDLSFSNENHRYSLTLLALLEEQELKETKSLLSSDLRAKLEELTMSLTENSLSRLSLEKFRFDLQRSVLASNDSISEESKMAIKNMDLETLKDFVNANPQSLSVISSQLDKNLLAALINGVQQNTVSSALALLDVSNQEKKKTQLEQFQEKSIAFSQKERSPLLIKNLRLGLNRLDPDKELEVYKALKAQGKRKEAKELAKSAFPAFLAPRLPADILKEAFNEVSISEIAGFLSSLEENERRAILNSIAQSGKKRDSIELEMREQNESRDSKVVSFLYANIKRQAKLRLAESEQEKLLEEWLESS